MCMCEREGGWKEKMDGGGGREVRHFRVICN